MRFFRANRGFSLLETLVAFSIAAVALGVIFRIYATGSTAVARAGDYAHAIVIAESRLAEFAVADDPGAAREGVEEGKYAWTIHIGDYPDDPSAALDSPVPLRLVEVEVRWDDRGNPRSLRLQTLRPAPPASGAG
jgi:general secretion pathway protein I